MFQTRRLDSSALPLTIVITFILGILSMGIILLSYYNRQIELRDTIDQKLQRNIESATNLLLSDSSIMTTNDSIDLFGEATDFVKIQKGWWGLWQWGAIKASQGNFSQKKGFLYGSILPPYMNSCIYLADHKRPLSLIGNTKLEGDAYLSKAGLRPSYINQRGFSYDKLIAGTIRISEEELPPLTETILDNLNTITRTSLNNEVSEVLHEGDSMTRSFFENTLMLRTIGPVQLNNVRLDGNIIVHSDSLITVPETAILKNIILEAPVIIFQKGFKGNVQAFASDSLVIGLECVFTYPSAVVLLKKKDKTDQNLLRIADNCSFDGLLITSCQSKDLSRSYVEIGKNTRIKGIIYVMGYLHLEGQIAGTVLTDYFIYRSSSTIYENHLVDVEISRKKLSPYFIGSAIFKQSQQRKIVQWLH